jgi:ABC-2 type transport system ATP-binding protein
MAALILRLKAQGKTILITSHLLAQMEDICDRIAILDRGRLVLEGKVSELLCPTDRRAVLLENLAENDITELRAWLAARGRSAALTAQPHDRLDRIYLEKVGRGDPAAGEGGR